jgi:acetyltransferase-like isoleucine patch superfamily enzyme
MKHINCEYHFGNATILMDTGRDGMKLLGKSRVGPGSWISEDVIIGFPSRENLRKTEYQGTVIGTHCVIRSGTVIYCDVTIGDHFNTGHNVVIRENSKIGDGVSIGTATVVEGYCTIGTKVNIQSMVYIPTETQIGDRVFIGPNAVLTNDRYPPSGRDRLSGPRIKEDVSIGANATVLPGVSIGKGSLVAAGAVVTKDVPPERLAVGNPARFRALPEQFSRRC